MSAAPTTTPPAPVPQAPPPTPTRKPVPPAATPARKPLLQPHVARLVGFVALAGFGGLQWAGMVQPAASVALLGSILAAAVAGGLLTALAGRRPPAVLRIAATLLAAVVLLAVALAAAGVPGRLFEPRGWDDLAAGIAQGLGAVSTVRTPYGGLDEWTRIVLVLGGCALAAVAALLAFVPRRGGAFGFPAAAAVALGALYTIPVMQHDVDLPWIAGLAFTLLLAIFLWLERVQQRGAGLAAGIVAVAALGGYAAAPVLDRDRALLDYEELAQSLSPSATAQYRWNHSYGPLDWPRDGREILRVRARQRSYWKAANLTVFDGTRWVQDSRRDRDDLETHVYDERWRQTIRVTLRALRTRQFIAAGSTLDIIGSPRLAVRTTTGVHESAGKPLRRGHAYRAVVYTPRPSVAQMRRASAGYPLGLSHDNVRVRIPVAAPAGALAIDFPWFGDAGQPTVLGTGAPDAGEVLAQSRYGRVYALARRLRAGARTPFDYVRAVERHLARGFTYSETPPRSAIPIVDFLLRDRVGYCQQFSGAMALLLRMGGVPARVATGFSPGSLDGERREYVVRDVDAHSWVEVYMPRIGWVTRDPTPPDSPARTQLADQRAGAPGEAVTSGGSERALGRSPDAGVADAQPVADGADSGPGAAVVVGAIGVVVATVAVALLVRRRRRRRTAPAPGDDADVEELLRALRRTGRPTPPQLTLTALARRYAGTPAQDYVRAVADARYGYGRAGPTSAQRAVLRRELGAGLGRGGRMRAWWALPPKPARRSGRGER
ncbi:MAG: transglutaminase domain-containing protein [Thermoleophilia bacterium]